VRVAFDSVAENTINRRVSAATNVDKLTMPLIKVAIGNTTGPRRDNVTGLPIGVKMLVGGGGELYNCAVISTCVPVMVNDAVVLKYVAIDVIVPSRGTRNTK
jgi:hypothetical protein